MTEHNIVKLSQPGPFSSLLTVVLCDGARMPAARAVEARLPASLMGMLTSCDDTQ